MLTAHPLIRTVDLDDARDQVSRVFCAHRLTAVGPSARVNLEHNRSNLIDLSLHFIDYGTAVRIVPGELTAFYLVQIPLHGASEIRCGRASIVSTPDLAAVPNPTESLDMAWGFESPHLVVHIPRARVEAGLSSLLGAEARTPLRFELGMDLTGGPGLRWRTLVDLLLADAELPQPRMHPLVRDQLEDALVLSLITSQPNNYSDSIVRRREPYAPKAIRAAMELCESAGDNPVSVSGLACMVGVSVRALQEGFRRHVGITPMAYLRDARLRRAHDELLHAPTGTTVAEIAYRWGFTHLGRFAHSYAARFGELPSETLHRRRSRS
jgi:AraC-like DNA-binding protein